MSVVLDGDKREKNTIIWEKPQGCFFKRTDQGGLGLLQVDGGRGDGGDDGGLGPAAQGVLEKPGQLGLPAMEEKNTSILTRTLKLSLIKKYFFCL